MQVCASPETARSNLRCAENMRRKEGILKDFIEYIDSSMEDLQKEEQELIAADRKDESNLVRIRSNIFGIARTLYEVTAKKESPENVTDAYLEKTDKLAGNWELSLQMAEEHDDIEKKVIEEVKLCTIQEINQKLREVGYDRSGSNQIIQVSCR